MVRSLGERTRAGIALLKLADGRFLGRDAHSLAAVFGAPPYHPIRTRRGRALGNRPVDGVTQAINWAINRTRDMVGTGLQPPTQYDLRPCTVST